MKKTIISMALNELDMRFVNEAEFFSGSSKKRSKILTAAMIAAMLCLVLIGAAFAYARWGLRDLNYEPEDAFGPETVNTSGYENSPNYMMDKDWEKYLFYLPWGENERPENYVQDIYSFYNAYSDEAKDKLNYLAESYGLKLIESWEHIADAEELYIRVGKSGFLPEKGELENVPYGGRYYQGGSFSLLDAAKIGDISICYDIYRYDNDYYVPGEKLAMDAESLEEWTYICADGTEVSLGLGGSRSAIAAELENCFVFVYIRSGTDGFNDPAKTATGYPAIDKSHLEAFAEAVDFTILDEIE